MQLNQANRQIPLRYFLQVLFKHKVMIAALFFSIVGTVTIGTLLMKPSYKATAKILLQRQVDSEQALLFRMDLDRDYSRHNWINSEIEILRSRPVVMRVIREVGLMALYRTGENKALPDSVLLEEIIKDFYQQLSIEPTKDATVVEIGYVSKDPQMAARIVQSVIRNYVDYRRELFEQNSRYRFVEQQIQEAEKRLRELEARRSQFQAASGLAMPDEYGRILYQKLADFEKQFTDVRAKRIAMESRLRVLERAYRNGESIALPAADPTASSRLAYINQLKLDLTQKEIQRQALLKKFTPYYEEVVNLTHEIEATRAKIHEEIGRFIEEQQAEIQALKSEEAVLRANIQKIKREIKAFSQQQFELEQLSRGIEESQEVYSILLKQREEARISLAKAEKGVNIKIISPPSVPVDPVSPNRRLNVILAVLVGGFVSLGAAFGSELLKPSIRTPEDVEANLGVPVLGSVKHFDAVGREKISG
ncbi:MAG: hypothetical protein D6715_08255 [Calditrichaeota bacterium]|nr:MAG: hypothetical protein D6715_08255 [Calditrichota bacterium]